MLSPERWLLVERLFHQALEHAPSDRGTFLETACGNDDALRREVESLLDAATSKIDVDASLVDGIAAGWATERSTGELLGRTLGEYRILSLLGAGGMGEVYLAEDLSLGRRVALKVLPALYSDDPDRLRRFTEEARAASALSHPNIITVYHVGDFEARRYIVTEFIDGETLRRRLRPVEAAAQQALPIGTALDIAIQVAGALRAAHDAGIVHRDVKPENIMIRTDGYAKVLDFGLAKLSSDERLTGPSDRSSNGGTRVGTVLGTPNYMAPEQAAGETVDARSDVFSLSVVLHEMVTGAVPGAAADTDLHAIRPKPVARVIARGLARDPELRYQTAGALLRDLECARQSMQQGRHRWLAPILVACAVALPLAAIVAFGRRSPDPGRSDVTPEVVRFERQSDHAATLAVLPFRSVGFGENARYFGLSLADSVISQMSRLSGVRIRPTTSIVEYTAGTIDPLAAAGKLEVDHLVTGEVRRVGGRIQVTTMYTNARTRVTGWTDRADLEDATLDAVQQELSQRITRLLVGRLTKNSEPLVVKARHTTDDQTRRLYWEGRSYQATGQAWQILRAVPLLQQTVARDPQFAQGYASLSHAYRMLGSETTRVSLSRHQAIPRAREAALRALALDADLADGHLALAMIQFGYDWDWTAAERSFQRALSLSPGSSQALLLYGWFLTAMSGQEAGLRMMEEARRLDPRSLIVVERLAQSLSTAGRDHDALKLFEDAAREHPTAASLHWRRARVLAKLERFEESVSEMEAAARINGTPDRARRIRRLFEQSGYRAVLEADLADRLEGRDSLAAARLYAQLGNHAAAFDQLAECIRTRNEITPFLRVDPTFAPLRTDPRFQALLVQVGLH